MRYFAVGFGPAPSTVGDFEPSSVDLGRQRQVQRLGRISQRLAVCVIGERHSGHGLGEVLQDFGKKSVMEMHAHGFARIS